MGNDHGSHLPGKVIWRIVMKVLFIGGTGVISSACSELAVARGIDLYLLNRGQSFRSTPEGTHVLRADIRNPETVTRVINGYSFDTIVDWIAYTPNQVQID